MRAQTLSLAGFEFWLVGSPVLRRTAEGHFHEYSFVTPEDQRLNFYAAGPFCRFGLPAAPEAPGVYAILVGGQLKYIGRSESLATRFGPSGYGSISLRKLHNDGQSTNCKLNSRILSEAKAGSVTQVWFHSTPEFVAVEAALIQRLKPEWNGRSEGTPNSDVPSPARGQAPAIRTRPGTTSIEAVPTKEDFDRELRLLLENASANGLQSIEVSAGQLHKLAGGYPGKLGKHHRMPVCCARMRATMRDGDQITYAPPKGNGARLSIEYGLPR